MLQNLIVGVIVLVAALYTLWALVPGRTRLDWAKGLGAWGRTPGRPAWLARATGGIERLAAAKQGGCSGCDPAAPAASREHEPPPR